MPKLVDSDERREFIAKIAAELIAEEGIEKATIREIAKRAGATRGLVEHHFRNKAEMIELALDWTNRRYLQRERQQLKDKRGLAALRARLSCLLPVNPTAKQEWRMRLRFWSSADKAVQTVQRSRLAETRRLFQAHIAEAIALGEVPASTDTAVSAERLLHSVAGLSANALVDGGHYSKAHLLAELEALLERLRAGAL